MRIRAKRTDSSPESAIAALENSLKCKLPSDYRSFLNATNGGRPLEKWFSDQVGVDDFLGVREIIATRSRLQGLLASNLLPIALCAGGNYLCFSLDHAGEILFWNHELEHLGAQAINLLALSFSGFVGQLKEEGGSSMPHNIISVEIDPEFYKWALDQEANEALQPISVWPPIKE